MLCGVSVRSSFYSIGGFINFYIEWGRRGYLDKWQGVV